MQKLRHALLPEEQWSLGVIVFFLDKEVKVFFNTQSNWLLQLCYSPIYAIDSGIGSDFAMDEDEEDTY